MANRIILAGDNSGKSGEKIVTSKLIGTFLFQQGMKQKTGTINKPLIL